MAIGMVIGLAFGAFVGATLFSDAALGIALGCVVWAWALVIVRP